MARGRHEAPKGEKTPKAPRETREKPEKAPREARAPREKGERRSRAWIAPAVVLAVIVLAIALVCVRAATWEGIYPGVSVDGLSLGGLSVEEASRALSAAGFAGPEGASLKVELPRGHSFTLGAKEAGATSDVARTARAAWEVGRGGNLLTNGLDWLRCRVSGKTIPYDGSLALNEDYVRAAIKDAALETDKDLLGSGSRVGEDEIELTKGVGALLVDEEALFSLVSEALLAGRLETIVYEPEELPAEDVDLEKLHEAVFRAPEDAYYVKNEGVVPAVEGRDFDLDEARRVWSAAAPGERVSIPLRTLEPDVTTEYLESILFADTLGQRSSTLRGSSSNRVNNITIACRSINGTVLMPGEEFSYNEALGKRTTEAGYLGAGAYLNGEVVTEIGGGICQVSSTLYCAALYANLKITDRTCHWFGVDYLPAGMDATVSWGGPEFKFVNDREYPIRIRAEVDRENWCAVVSIEGTDTDGSYVEITSSTWTEEHKYGATTYRWVYDRDGKLISKTMEARSEYHFHEDPSPSPEPSESPEPTESPSPEPEPSPEPTETPEPSESPAPTESPEPTETPEPSESPAPTESPEPTETPEPTSDPTPTPEGEGE